MSQVVALPSAISPRSVPLGAAIAEFLAAGDFRPSTVAVYERTLEGLLDDLGADVALERVSRSRLDAHLRNRYGHCAPATYNRHLATIGSMFTWAVDAGHLPTSPAARLRRRKERRSRAQELQANAIAFGELQALWRDSRFRLRDRTFWALAYSTAARADELLSLDIEHLDLPNRQAQIIGKGGSAERIFWDSEAARLLARLIAGRRSGPVFLSDLALPRPAARRRRPGPRHRPGPALLPPRRGGLQGRLRGPHPAQVAPQPTHPSRFKSHDPEARPRQCKIELWILFNTHQVMQRMWPADRRWPNPFAEPIDRVMGSRDAWEDLYREGKPATHLMRRYGDQLRSLGYTYVDSQAIRDPESGRDQYHMIHASDHPAAVDFMTWARRASELDQLRALALELPFPPDP